MENGRLLRKQIEDLPNEVILQILINLEIKDLIRCSYVSKRIRSISYNETLWQKINLYGCEKVPMEFLHFVVNNGCKYLSLEWAVFDSIQSFDSKDFFTKPTQLKYLILSIANNPTFQREIQENLLASCYSLEKLSLQNISITSNMINNLCLQNGKTLQVLDLSHSRMDHISCPDFGDWIRKIVDNCVELTEINLSHSWLLSQDSINYLVSNITLKLQKISFNKYGLLHDEHSLIKDDQVESLVKVIYSRVLTTNPLDYRKF